MKSIFSPLLSLSLLSSISLTESMLLRAIQRQPITNSESHGVISIGIKAWKKIRKKIKNKK